MASRIRFIAGATATMVAGIATRADALTALVRVAYFPGVSALPLLIAGRARSLASEGLDARVAPTTSSAELFAQLDAGTLDLAHTSIDNPIAYDVGAGAAALAHRDF